MKKTLLASAVALVALAFGATAIAGTSTAPMPVNATVGNICDITGTPPTALAFGSITSALSAPVDSTSKITVNCNAAMPFTVNLKSVNAGGVDGGGLMKGTTSSGNTIHYNTFSDSAYSVVWGSTSTDAVSGNGVVGTPQILTVYGQIPAGFASPTGNQNQLVPAPDSYTDTITVTVSY